jgi:hypothetical protein
VVTGSADSHKNASCGNHAELHGETFITSFITARKVWMTTVNWAVTTWIVRRQSGKTENQGCGGLASQGTSSARRNL